MTLPVLGWCVKLKTEFAALIRFVAIPLLLAGAAAFAQDQETGTTVEPETAAEEAAPLSQDVEANEDNYRQFMELKDPLRQRPVIPENAFKPGTGLKKLEDLPEESQKHLRNQLREVIVESGPWQPGEEQEDYPYVPSEAALKNSALQKQEAEAWGELVASYHEREAEIYANAARTRAAAAAGEAAMGADSGRDGTRSGESRGKQGTQAGERGRQAQGDAADSYSPGATRDPDATAESGVSQNALEFLRQSGAGNPSAANDDVAANESESGNESAKATASQPVSESASPPNGDSTALPDAIESESTGGASQNALQYLTGGGDATENDTSTEPRDTLSIEELLQARGVTGSTGSDSSAGVAAEDEPDPDTDDENGS